MNLDGDKAPELWVRGDTRVNALAGSIAGHARQHEDLIKLKAIGAGAVNAAVKSVATARGYIAPEGMELSIVPAFWVVDDDSQKSGQLTGILLTVKVGREG